MKISGFAAASDIVGHRVRIGWDFLPEGSETLADVPPVTLRRKERDFAFPPAQVPDPWLVYDSSAFPPAPIPGTLSVIDLPPWEASLNDGSRVVYEPISVAVPIAGRMMEALRRTVGTMYDATGSAVQQRVEILDAGQQPGNLRANTVYYYQLFNRDLPESGDAAAPFRNSAMVTNSYGLNRTLYDSLPAIYRRHDVTTRPITPGIDTVPEQAPNSGQLRRFVDLFGISLDSMRGTAEGLRTLHEIDRVDARYLTLIAQWIGWDLSVDNIPIELRRNELKTASRLYRLVGTLPGLRALVTQLTGWTTLVAELAQNVALSNRPAQRNLFAVTVDADGARWQGVDEAADVLGFRSINRHAIGSASKAASLTGTVAGPFALRPGMELTLKVDGLLPVTVRFGPQDFANLQHATADEVAAALNRTLPEIVATSSGGRLVLTSESVGDQSEIEILPAPTSLVSLEGAPGGRLSPFTDALGRTRLFYEAWEAPTQEDLFITGPTSVRSNAGSYVRRRVHYKTFLDGTWRASHPMFERRLTQQADPAALTLPDNRTWVAWIDDPQTAGSLVRFALGTSRPTVPARAFGQRREPFALADGRVVTIRGDWTGVDQFTVHAASFADPLRATAVEVVAAMNAQLTHVAAVRGRDGSIGLETLAGGAQARLAVDLAKSTAARALGFDSRNASGTPGSWSHEIDWSVAMDAVSIPSGRLTELAAVNDPVAGVRSAWSTHRDGRWRIASAFWREQVMAATANGLFARTGTAAWLSVGGLPSTDVRSVEVDSDGTTWIATAAGVVRRRPDGILSALAAALPSTDVRQITLAPDGTVWFATAAGASALATDGTVATLTMADGLPSNDIRATAIAADGTVWIATGAGLAKRVPTGALVTTSSDLPSASLRDIRIDRDTLYVATGAGLAIGQPGAFAVVNATNGLGSADARAVAVARDGTVWVATAHGASKRSADKIWTTLDAAQGLLSDDVRTIAIDAVGAIWIGTAAGIGVVSPDGLLTNIDIIGGGAPNPAVRSVHTGWSSSRELADGGGGNREPTLALDENNQTWLIWSQCVGSGNLDESWGLRYRIFDPTGRTWGAEKILSNPPGAAHSSDRMPSAQRIAGGMRVFFSSDRNGGFGLWFVDVTLGGIVAPMVSILDEPSGDVAPVPISVGGAVWVLYRSDRNLALAHVGSSPLEEGLLRSVRVPDNGTIRRYAGHVSMTPPDLARSRTRRMFGDLLSYSPNRPDGRDALTDDDLYTRGTIGLYVSPTRSGAPVTQQEAVRLRELLGRFIPANLRALVIMRASALTEFVYLAGTDIQESYHDDYPFAESLGLVTDASAATMPGVVVLRSNTADNVSANFADLSTLRRRTFFPPLQ